MSAPSDTLTRRVVRACPWAKLKLAMGERAAARLDLPVGPLPCERIHGRFRMTLDLRYPDERSMFLDIYEFMICRLVRRLLRTGDTFIDCGANIGYITLLASGLVGAHGRVFAFEPNPRVLGRLERHLSDNDIENVTLMPCGCWESTGEATLYDFADAESGTGEVSMKPHVDRDVDRAITIRTLRIDEAVEGPVRLMKLDVEGAEWAALRGAERILASGRPPNLVMEINARTCESFGYDPLDMVDWLLGVCPSYRLHLVRSRRIEPVDRGSLAMMLREKPGRHRNVWLEPAHA